MITSDCSSVSQLVFPAKLIGITLVVIGGIDELAVSIEPCQWRVDLRYHPSRSRYPRISLLNHSSFHYP